MTNMWNKCNKRFIVSLAVIVPCCVCAPTAHGEECYSVAYRYCCDLIPEFNISCPGVPGGCWGEVANGQNGFRTVLVLGGFTENSFEVDGVPFACHYYAPICNPANDPACSVDYSEIIPRNCIAWKMKQHFTMCEDQ